MCFLSKAESLMSYWSAFDDYRKKFLVGELIWNFADIKTEQGLVGSMVEWVGRRLHLSHL